MLIDVVVRVRDFIGNLNVKFVINEFIIKVFNNKVKVDMNGKLFRCFIYIWIFVESVLFKNVNL